MAIPSTTYDIATASNPSSALTDFTFIVDLSDMSSAWWTACTSSVGAKGRASKGDGTTELATDWIDFDDTAETGLVRIKWSGTLASSGTQQVRIYPPVTGNSTYGVSDTYGQYNAYDSDWDAYYADGSGLTDRTSNNRTGTQVGTPQAVSGLIGDATAYDGSNESCNLGATWTSGYTDLSMSVLINPDSITGERSLCSVWEADFHWLFEQDSAGVQTANSSFESANGGTAVVNTWQTIGGSFTGSTSIKCYIDGAEAASNTDISGSALNTTSEDMIIANNATDTKDFDGTMQHLGIHSTTRALSWFAEESDQLTDNATFWGTWTNVPVSGGNAPTADLQGCLVGPLGGPVMSTFF